MKAKEIMTAPAITISEDQSLEDAAQLMLQNRIGGLPVVDAHGLLVGILTESDFCAREKGIPFSLFRFPHVFHEWIPEQSVEQIYAAARNCRVADVMTRSVVSVHTDDSLDKVLTSMMCAGYHRVPVIRDGRPVGVIARHDLLRLIAAEPYVAGVTSQKGVQFR